jgi:hypothetical protein
MYRADSNHAAGFFYACKIHNRTFYPQNVPVRLYALNVSPYRCLLFLVRFTTFGILCLENAPRILKEIRKTMRLRTLLMSSFN